MMLKKEINVSRSTVGVLGLTFKENCPDIRNSKVVELIRELQDWGLGVVVNDPWANPEEVREEYGIELTSMASFQKVDSLVIAVGHREYRDLTPDGITSFCKSPETAVIADLKSLFDRHALANSGLTVFRL
jgi:UDP-N-acetyl-D-galactosamine dehydrogenase